MEYEEFKKLMENAPEGSPLADLRYSMEKGAEDTINQLIKELMTEYSLTYGEAFHLLKRNWDRYYKTKKEERRL